MWPSIVILDYDKYFRKKFSESKDYNGLYTNDFNVDSDIVQYAFSPAGVSQPYVGNVRGGAVTAA